MYKIGNVNGFADIKALRLAARDKRVREIEGWGMDDGRVFIHLVSGYVFDGYESSSKSVGSSAEIERVMSLIKKREISVNAES